MKRTINSDDWAKIDAHEDSLGMVLEIRRGRSGVCHINNHVVENDAHLGLVIQFMLATFEDEARRRGFEIKRP